MPVLNNQLKNNFFPVLARAIALLFLAVLTACAPTQKKLSSAAVTSIQTGGNEIVFDCFTINHAWGHQMSGFFIDNQGGVYQYQRKGATWRPNPVMRENQRFYDKKELFAKFTEKSLATNIDPAILQSKLKMINIAEQGAVSHQKKKVADAGQSLCLAYRYGEYPDLYRPVALGSFGVSEKIIINHSVAAQSLLKWLINDVSKHQPFDPKTNALPSKAR